MAIQITETGISVRFDAVLDDGRRHTDALHFSPGEFTASTAATRRELARTRAREWAKAVDNPTPAPPAVPETRAERRARLRIMRAEALEAQAAAERELAATEADDDQEA